MTQPPMDSIKTAHVLAVDDDPSMRQMIADYLGDNEVRVTAVASGQEIAEVMAHEMIDLVVLDLRLPGEDGMQLLRQVRAQSQIEQHEVDHFAPECAQQLAATRRSRHAQIVLHEIVIDEAPHRLLVVDDQYMRPDHGAHRRSHP